MKKIDIFLCYRRAGAQTAKLLKRYLEETGYPGNVWYSDDESYGNYKNDIPGIVGMAECVVIFVDENFTKGFDDNDEYFECITALEMIQIEKKIQKEPDFRILIVDLNGKGFTKRAQEDLERLFRNAGILINQSLSHFAQSNTIPFDTAKDDEYVLFDKLSKEMLPDSFFDKTKLYGNFLFGSRRTMADVIVWDEEKGILSKDIVFELLPESISLYEKIEQIRCKDEEVKQNNQMISLSRVEVNLSDDREEVKLVVNYQQIDYKLFRKTLRIWNTAGLNLNQKLMTYDADKDYYEIPNAMGMAFMVVTRDNKLIFTKRSKDREIRANEYDCSIVEGLKPEVWSEKHGNYSIYNEDYVDKEIHRAYREEISANDADIEIIINGIILDKEYGQWNIVGTIRTEDTSEELLQQHPLRSDTYERVNMEVVSIYDENGYRTLEPLKLAFGKFLKNKMWGMAFAALYSALKNEGFTDKEIREADI